MPKTFHRRDVLGWLFGIGILVASAGCSITSVGIDTPNGKAFAVETRRLPKSANDDSARMNLRTPGASITEDSHGEVSLSFAASQRRLTLRPPSLDTAHSSLLLPRADPGNFMVGIFSILAAQRVVGTIPDALACEVCNPASTCRTDSIELARELLGNQKCRMTGTIGDWQINSPVVLQPDDRALLASLIAPGASPPTASDATILNWDCSGDASGRVLWETEIGANCRSISVAEGKVLVGTTRPDPSGDIRAKSGGRLMCFDATSGKLLWKIDHDPLPQRVHDEGVGIVSRPEIDRDRVYYVSNRGELVCAGLNDGHRIWTLDMIGTLGVFKRDVNDSGALAPSPIVDGDLVFCITGNGGDFDDSQKDDWSVPNPEAPSFIAVNKSTGKLVWSSNAPGRNILYGQWSTPAMAWVDGRSEILFAGGDGLLYAFDPPTGKLLWKVDCRQSQSPLGMKDFIVAPPLVHGTTAYVSMNRDFEQGAGRPHALVAIDLATHAVRWSLTDPGFDGTFGPMAINEGVLYAVGTGGKVLAMDAASGKVLWSRLLEPNAQVLGGVCLNDGKIYIGGTEVLVLSARCGCPLAKYEMRYSGSGVSASVCDGVLYVVAGGRLAALKAWNSQMK